MFARCYDFIIPTFKKINLALAVVARMGRAPRRLGAEAARLLDEQQQDGWPRHCRMHGSVLVLRWAFFGANPLRLMRLACPAELAIDAAVWADSGALQLFGRGSA